MNGDDEDKSYLTGDFVIREDGKFVPIQPDVPAFQSLNPVSGYSYPSEKLLRDAMYWSAGRDALDYVLNQPAPPRRQRGVKADSFLYLKVGDLLALYCSDNDITLSTGPTGIPRDAVPLGIDVSPDGKTVRIRFATKTGPEGMHYNPTFDLTD